MPKKKLQKSCQKRKVHGNKKFRFELSPSKTPLKYRELWRLDDEFCVKLQEKSTSGITELTNLWYSEFSRLHSTSYLWLDYSSVLYSTYHGLSYNAYTCIRNINYPSLIDSNVELLFNSLKLYYINYLGVESKHMHYSVMERTCKWFLYHLARTYIRGSIGLKVSLDKNFYTVTQKNLPVDERISGKVVGNLIDMLSYKGNLIVFKGYSLPNFFDKKEVHSAMTLLLLDESVFKLLPDKDVLVKLNIAPDRREIPLVQVKRKSSKSKSKGKKMYTVLTEDEYTEHDKSVIDATESILNSYNSILRTATIKIGKYEIPELFFRRIFINSVDEYGRLHDSEFQTTPSALRKQVIIDEDETITWDIKHLHPSLLYIKEGVVLPDDFSPYPILDIVINQKRIKKFKKFYGIEKYDPVRNFTKLCLLVMINSKSWMEALISLENKLKSDYSKGNTCREKDMQFVGLEDINVEDVMEAVKEHNKPINKHFNTGISTHLMNLDSNIIISAIKYLTDRNIVCLPVHDSLTVKVKDSDDAVKALEYGFKETMHTLDNFKLDKD